MLSNGIIVFFFLRYVCSFDKYIFYVFSGSSIGIVTLEQIPRASQFGNQSTTTEPYWTRNEHDRNDLWIIPWIVGVVLLAYLIIYTCGFCFCCMKYSRLAYIAFHGYSSDYLRYRMVFAVLIAICQLILEIIFYFYFWYESDRLLQETEEQRPDFIGNDDNGDDVDDVFETSVMKREYIIIFIICPIIIKFDLIFHFLLNYLNRFRIPSETEFKAKNEQRISMIIELFLYIFGVVTIILFLIQNEDDDNDDEKTFLLSWNVILNWISISCIILAAFVIILSILMLYIPLIRLRIQSRSERDFQATRGDKDGKTDVKFLYIACPFITIVVLLYLLQLMVIFLSSNDIIVHNIDNNNNDDNLFDFSINMMENEIPDLFIGLFWYYNWCLIFYSIVEVSIVVMLIILFEIVFHYYHEDDDFLVYGGWCGQKNILPCCFATCEYITNIFLSIGDNIPNMNKNNSNSNVKNRKGRFQLKTNDNGSSTSVTRSASNQSRKDSRSGDGARRHKQTFETDVVDHEYSVDNTTDNTTQPLKYPTNRYN